MIVIHAVANERGIGSAPPLPLVQRLRSGYNRVGAIEERAFGYGDPIAIKPLEVRVLVHTIVEEALLLELPDQVGYVRRKGPDLYRPGRTALNRPDVPYLIGLT